MKSMQSARTASDATSPVAGENTRTPNSAPRVLLLSTTCDWPLAARLAIRFSETGCHVEAICPSGNPVLKTTALSRAHIYNALAPLRAFRREIQNPGYDLLVPCDDLAAAHLHDLYESDIRAKHCAGDVAALVKRSLGTPGSLAVIASRSSLLEIARDEGIKVPNWASIGSSEELQQWLTTNGLPTVLKADGTGGGRGVRIVGSYLESDRAFKRLSRPPVIRVLKRVIVNRDSTVILPFLLKKHVQLSAQSYIPGYDATISISCWEGNVLAGIAFEVLQTVTPNGPASVVRLTDDGPMTEAAVRLAYRLHLSGFYGLDFRIDDNKCAWLIEMNPRATQSTHLSMGVDRDPVAALVSAVSGRRIAAKAQVTSRAFVAFFPNEWERNPGSEFLSAAYHDVPWSEPALLRSLLKEKPLAARYL